MTALQSLPTAKIPWSGHLRIIWTLAAKDIVAALKNKTTLTTIIISLLMVFFYRYMPLLTSDGDTLRVFVYAENDSVFLEALERSPALSIYTTDSYERMIDVLSDTEEVELGLVIPEAAEAQLVETTGPIEIDGYVMYWLTPDQRAEVKALLEAELAIEFDRPITLNLQDHEVFLSAESGFFGFGATFAFIFVPLMIGISLIPHLMVAEKKDKTLDALLVSPATAAHIVTGKALAGIFYSLTGYVVIFAVFRYLIIQWGLVLTAALVATLFMTAIGLLLGSYVEVSAQLQLVAWFIILPLLLPVLLIALEGLIPSSVIAFMRWIPTVSVAKIFQLGLTPDKGFALYAADLIVSLGVSLLLFGSVVWFVRRQDRI
ncbi:MAG: ABC transporter permease [Ardenticatenaceae bacterium]|nr:ABC transporter permease [Ardenticatenaceae bacterium]